MYRPVITAAKEKMEKTKEFYQKDMLALRAGRANPQILDKIMVDYYGTPTPLKQMGNIPRRFPWWKGDPEERSGHEPLQ